jgi:ornithine cyclodeaminase/alanine dehydrogenase-like protein (mu-crystallin family)
VSRIPSETNDMLLISNEDVRAILRVEDCMRAQEAAFADLPSGRAIQRPRIDVYAPAERSDAYYRWSSMEGVTVQPGPYFATRIKSDVVYWPRSADGHVTEQKFCGTPGLYCGLVMVFSTRDGRPLAIINDGVLQHMRVGAGAGIGARYLAREDATKVGVLGSGGMARVYLEAFVAIRKITQAKVYSPNEANRRRFAQEMGRALNIEVIPVGSARDAVDDADIIATCTDSMSPVLDAQWLEPGMHVTNVGPAEIGRACYARFDVIFRQGDAGNSAEALAPNPRLLREIGQSPIAYVAGTDEEMQRLPSAANRVGFGGDFPHVVELITGARQGRSDPNQITFYHNFGHQGLQFASVGGLAYERAVATGVGRKLPDEWFMQDIRN